VETQLTSGTTGHSGMELTIDLFASDLNYQLNRFVSWNYSATVFGWMHSVRAGWGKTLHFSSLQDTTSILPKYQKKGYLQWWWPPTGPHKLLHKTNSDAGGSKEDLPDQENLLRCPVTGQEHPLEQICNSRFGHPGLINLIPGHLNKSRDFQMWLFQLFKSKSS